MDVRFAVLCLVVALAVVLVGAQRPTWTRPTFRPWTRPTRPPWTRPTRPPWTRPTRPPWTRPTLPPGWTRPTRPTRPTSRPRPPSPPLPLGCSIFYPLRNSDLNCDIGRTAVVPADDASRGCPAYRQGSCDAGRLRKTPCMPEMEDLTSVIVRRRWRLGQRRPPPECCQVLCEDGMDVKYADCSDYDGDDCECRRGRDRKCKKSVDRRRPIKIKVKCPGKEPEMYKLCLTQCCRCSPRRCRRRG